MAENLVPALRFRGFDGEWEEKIFFDIADVFRGLTYSPLDVRDKGIRVLRSSNIDGNFFITDDKDVFVDTSAINIPYVENNDILITSACGSPKLVGKHALVRNLPSNTAVHGGFMLLVKSKLAVFLESSMYSDWYRHFVGTCVCGGNGAIGNLNKNDLEKQYLAIPSTIEQQKIGKFMADLDKLIAGQKQRIEKLKNLKKALLEKLFPGQGEKIPALRFKGFDGEWEEKKLGEIALDFFAGGDVDVDMLKPKGRYPVLANALTNDGIVGYYDNFYRVEAPAITITGRGNVGHAQVRKVNFTPVVRLLVMKTKCDCKFIEEAINIKKIIVESTGVPQLTVPQVVKVGISLATSNEQQKIGTFMADLDKLIKLQSDKLAKLQNMKQGCLRKMFV